MLSKLKSFFIQILLWFPISIWLLIILTESFLVKIHEIFSLFIGIIPVFSLFIFIYYLFIFIVKRSRSNVILVSLILLICVFKYTDHWLSFAATPSKNSIKLKVMTWNVQRLGSLSNAKNSSNNLNKLAIKLDSNSADIVILQEISKRQINQIANKLNLSSDNIQWTNYYSGAKAGLAILLLNNISWSLSRKQSTDLPPSWKCVFAEIEHISGQTINLLGVHIAPPKVTDDQLKGATKKLIKGEGVVFKEILRRYVRQARKQNKQIDKINNMVSGFKDPTIIAGDFNSTCQLPMHRELRDNLTDTWIEGGNGIGATRYWANLLPFRIDYIYTTDQFNIADTYTGDAAFSDHHPLISEVFIEL